MAIDEDPSGSFWDTGVGAVTFHDGDHWSQDGSMEHDHWTDLGPSSTNGEPSLPVELSESSAP
jgi:hypothetical protein